MNIKVWGIIVFLGAIGFGLFQAMQMGEKSPIIAEGTIELSPELDDYALNAETLFITIFDAQSESPMPYGAIKERITPGVTGEFFKFLLTKEKMMMMGAAQGGEMPKNLRIKARLDNDGMGGQDQPGDIVGSVSNVPFGATGVKIVLDELVGHLDTE
jgi:hypothetical protein